METENKPKQKKPLRMMVLAVGIIVAGYFGITRYLYATAHEVTDDAQLEGNILPIIPRVNGYADSLNIEDNKVVKTGDLLIRLDDKDFILKVKQAETALLNAQSDYEMKAAFLGPLRLNIITNQSQIKNSAIRKNKSELDYNRVKNMLAAKASTQQQYDDAKAEYDASEISLQIISEQLQTAKSQLAAESTKLKTAEINIEQKKIELETAQLNLSYTKILSPVNGTVSRKNVQPGQYLQQGSPLFAITSDEQPWVVANFKETQAAHIKKGMEVSVKVDAYPGTEFKGVVETISPATGARFSLLPPDNATGNFVKVVQRISVKIILNAYDKNSYSLCAGMSCTAAVSTN